MNPIKGRDLSLNRCEESLIAIRHQQFNATFLCMSLSLKFYDFWGKVQHLSGSKVVAEN